MFSTFVNAFKIKDLRKKILYTVLLIVVYRLGSAIPIPGVNLVAWQQATSQMSAMSDFMSIMSGSAFSQFTIFAMGISPYITASIILQLLTIAIPALERMSKEEDGRQKIERITRYAGVGLAVVQAIGIVVSFGSASGVELVSRAGGLYVLRLIIIAICAAAGTAFLMWLGERITEKGIGNGISMLIFASIVSRVPDFFKQRISAIAAAPGEVMTWVKLLLTIAVILALIAFVVYIDKAVRKIPVQYAKRVVGRKMYGGQNTHLPMKANANGVLPLIFAMTIMQFPEMIMQFFKQGGGFMNFWYRWMVSSPRVWDAASGTYAATSVMKATNINYVGIQYAPFVYYLIYFLLIIAFGYFYTSITFNPVEMSKNLQQNGGFIPGIRPGKPTGEYLGKISNRLTLFGSLFLAVIAIVPTIILNMMGVTNMFGATSVLIMVSVALETTEQLESQMLMRHYKGFLN